MSEIRTRNGAFNRWYVMEWKAPSFVHMFREAFEAGQVEARASERQRIRPLLLALHNLYEVVWHQIGTVDLSHVAPGYNGISYDDDNAIDEAAKPVEALLATREFADLLDGDGDEG